MKRKRSEIVGSDGELLAPFLRKSKRGEKPNTGRRGLLIMFVLVNIGLLAMVAYINSASRMQLANMVTVPVEQSATTPSTTPQVRERTVTIEAQAGWQSGEVLLEPGEIIEITYVEGQWVSWPGTGPFGPDGGASFICDQEDCVEPLRAYAQAGMIGRIGDDGEIFPVGYRYTDVAETSGELQLRINDDNTTDNSGSITMRVVVKQYND